MIRTTALPIDTYYRGYRLSSIEGETHIYFGPDLLHTETLLTKGRHRTTTEAAQDIVDGYLNAR